MAEVTTRPLGGGERAAAARLMEAVRDSLGTPLDPPAKYQLCAFVRSTLDRGALALREGRPDHADRAVADLDGYVADLAKETADGA